MNSVADSHQRPIAARLTAAARGAVATIGLSGDDVVPRIREVFRPATAGRLERCSPGEVLFGRFGPPPGDEVVLARLTADQWELHCHGGMAAVDMVLDTLEKTGFDVVDWQRYVALSDRPAADRIVIEARQQLPVALTWRAGRILLDQVNGALSRTLQEAMQNLAARRSSDAIDQLQGVLKWAELGCHLRRPWKVVLAGPPNVGKSSLMNALMGFTRAIVFDQPGTTRDVVRVTTALNGWPVELSDTAGLRTSDDALESSGVRKSQDVIRQADLVIWVTDATQADANTEITAPDACQRQIVVKNKADLLEDVSSCTDHTLLTSATQGTGVSELAAEIADRLVPTIPPPGAAVPFTIEQIQQIERILKLLETGRRDQAMEAISRLLK